MSNPLPDISGLSQVSDADWRAFGERLNEHGLDARYLRRIWPSGFRIYERLQQASRLWAARRATDPATFAYRALILRDPVTEDQAAAFLGNQLLDKLTAAGLLIQPAAGQIVSLFDCRFFMGAVILCDDLAYLGDAVFGAGPGTEAFTGLSLRRLSVPRALDVGSGAGGAALWLASRAGCVVASDINPRALEFVRINAAINGVRNVETRLGDLFEPVAGETFDLIIGQPPFVPTPPSARAARYRNGGAVGHELLQRLFAELPAHLTPDGRAAIVLEQAVMRGGDETPAFEPVQGLGQLFILGDAAHADEYSIRNAAQYLREGVAAFDAEATRMRDHLDQIGVLGVRPGVCIAAASALKSGWTDVLEARGTLWEQLPGAGVDRLYDGHALLREARSEANPPLRIADDIAALRRVGVDGHPTGDVYLALPAGHLVPSLQLTEAEWDSVLGWRREAATLPQPLVERLLRAGFHDA